MTLPSNKLTLLTSSLLSSSFLLFSAQAFAQETPPVDAETSEAIIDLEADDTMDNIIVTGSRIRRNEYTSSAPVQIINTEASSLAGLMTASDILQGASVAAGSGQINNTFGGFVVNGGAGVNTVSLRGLGAQRTLVLLNGRRLGPAGISGTVGAVDLNIIPNSAINRFEILKDGASSIYGSDAVAGVANLITKDNMEGWNVGATVNITELGGGENGNIYASYGKTMDRLSFNVSGEYAERKSLKRGDRDQFSCPEDYIFSVATGERSDAIDTRTGEFKCFNALEGYIQTFFPDDAAFGVGGGFFGSRVPDASVTTPTETSPIAGYRFIPYQERSFDDPRQLEEDVISPNKNYSLFAEATYSPSQFDNLEIYAEALFSRRESEQKRFRQLFPFIHQDSSVNPLNSTAFNNPSFAYGPLFGLPAGSFQAPLEGLQIRPIVLVPTNSSQEVNYIRGVAGIRGEFVDKGFFSAWNYDLNVVHSESSATYYKTIIIEDHLAAGIGTDTRDSSFIGVCGPTAPAGCVPLPLASTDILFDGNFTQAQSDYLFANERGTTDYTQTIIEGVITGDLMEAPAGTIGVAVGVSSRWDKIDDTPGEYSRAGNSWGLSSANRTEGTDRVTEIFGEVEIPLIKGKSFFEDLSFNGSARYSDYKSVGGATTYKVGLNWALDDTFRFRTTHGTSFRAPALYELFLNEQTGFLSQISVDPCIRYGVPGEDGNINTPAVVQANCAADGLPADYNGNGSSARVTTSGGLGTLEAEDSVANSIGFIFTPQGTGLSVAIDYFTIEVNNQITASGAGVIGACYRDADFRSVAGFCDLFTRDLDSSSPTFGQITEVDGSYRNIPSQTTKGFDITARYEHEYNFGNLIINSQFTVTNEEKYALFADDVVDFNGTAGDPKVVGTVQALFTRKDWTGSWTANYTGGTDNLDYEGEDGLVNYFYSGPSTQITAVDAFITHDVSIRKEWDTLRVVVGVSNLFAATPSRLSTGDDVGTAGRLGVWPFSSQYFEGYLGRQFFMTVEKSF
ncbi:MAG: TonB-dependent receptor [Robiginitomaculum sp.]|nr:MAG: TonB-dependent receptor [Robiginitomaculum sp.]